MKVRDMKSVGLALLIVGVMVMAVPIPSVGFAKATDSSGPVNYGLVENDQLLLGGHVFQIHGDLDDRALYIDGQKVQLGGILPWWISGIETGDRLHLVVGDAAYRTFLSHYIISEDGGATWTIQESFWGRVRPHMAIDDTGTHVMFERSTDSERPTVFKLEASGFQRVDGLPNLDYASVLDYRNTEEYIAYDIARSTEFKGTPATSSGPARAEAREWCYIYVCNGEASGIEAYLEADANEMAAGGSSANHWSICLFDDDGAGTNQVRVMNDGGGGYTSYTMAQVGLSSEPNLGDPATYITFLDWCFTNYPGNKVVWDSGGHGGGTDGCIFDETPVDDISLVEITTLANSLMTTLGRPIDITSWDTCITHTQEWIYGYKPITDYTVASMDNIVGAGFDYTDLMNYLSGTVPAVNVMANYIANSYWTGESAYISVTNMNNWDYNFMPTLNNLWQKLRHGSYTSTISTAWSNAFQTNTAPNRDVWGWMSNLNSAISDTTIKNLAATARDQTWTANYPSGLNDAVLAEYGSSTSHHGLGDEKVANTNWKIDIETIRNEAFSQSGVSNTEPGCTISSPTEGSDVPMDGSFTITGTASDSDGSVSRVEVKINREWWTVASGTGSWSYSWDVGATVDYYGLGACKVWARSYDGTDYSNYQCINVNIIESFGSAGAIYLDRTVYLPEDTMTVTVTDGDLTAPSISVNVKSGSEPAGETVTLYETALEGKYEGTLTISETNSAGILRVAHGDTITATYNDANDGSGPAVVTDTATVDGQVLAPSGLTVEWTGTTSATLLDEDFSSGVPPTGWSELDPTGDWVSYAGSNAGGTAPEARFEWYNGVNIWRLYAGPLDTTGMTSLDLQWRNYNDDYGVGVDCLIQTSSDASTWHDTSWVWTSGSGNYGPALETMTVNTADVGSSTFYISWTVDGNAYQLDYWYVDDVLMTYTGGATTDDNLLTWTLSPDDGAGANDVSHYNIYRADNAAGPWDAGAIIDTAPAGTSTYTDFDKGEPDGINWWYVVRAEDLYGNTESNSIAVPEETGSLTPYEIDLGGEGAASWVFISFPHDVSGNIQSLLNDATLGDGATSWSVAKWYDPQDASDPWKTYRAGASTNDLATISNAQGVWLWLTANGGDQRLTVAVNSDYPAASVNVNLYTGWNLVGYPSATSRLASTTLPGQADMVAYYNNGAPYLVTDALPTAVTFSEGNAYWVHVSGDCVWSVAP